MSAVERRYKRSGARKTIGESCEIRSFEDEERLVSSSISQLAERVVGLQLSIRNHAEFIENEPASGMRAPLLFGPVAMTEPLNGEPLQSITGTITAESLRDLIREHMRQATPPNFVSPLEADFIMGGPTVIDFVAPSTLQIVRYPVTLKITSTALHHELWFPARAPGRCRGACIAGADSA